MNKGFTGAIAKIDLTTGTIDKLQMGKEFYRKYPGGSSLGAYFILKHTQPDTDPLSPGNVLVMATGPATGAAVSGAGRFCVTSLSPLTGQIGDGQAGGDFGPALKRAGFDALVITGRSEKLSYLYIKESGIKIVDALPCQGLTVSAAYKSLLEKHGTDNISIAQCGPAGEKLVSFANIMSDRNDAVGRCGLGAVMGSKNLRAVVVNGSGKVDFSDEGSMKALNKKAVPALKESEFLSTLKNYGTPGLVRFNAESGNLPTHNFSRGFHVDHMHLDGSVFEKEIGAGKTTCSGCIIACRKRVKTEKPFIVSDNLGGPEYETLGLLGSNLDIFDAAAVAKANELCNDYGLDTITMGSIAGYLFECREKELVTAEKADGLDLQFGDIKSLLQLIEKTAARDGFGNICAGGFEALISDLGEETRPLAIQVKGSGLPAHMPRIKPAMALMYSLCPIGPDHMSCEHDWLVASDSEAARGLGILETDTASSTGPAKVKMTACSQLYFSLLDTLSLCMFCWGPGNLFAYSDLVDLVNFATGWDMTFWELMKAGERRINLMQLINTRRGHGKAEEPLPLRVYEQLPDGPSKGKSVNKDELMRMINEYYELMGWDPETGVPSKGKIYELGLNDEFGENL